MSAWEIFELLIVLSLPVGIVGLLATHFINNSLVTKKDEVRKAVFQSYHPVCPKCKGKKLRLKRMELRDGVYKEPWPIEVIRHDGVGRPYKADETEYTVVDVATIVDDVTCMTCGATVSHTVTPPDPMKYRLETRYGSALSKVVFEGDYDFLAVDHATKNEVISKAVFDTPEYKDLDRQMDIVYKFRTFSILALVFCVIGLVVTSCTP